MRSWLILFVLAGLAAVVTLAIRRSTTPASAPSGVVIVSGARIVRPDASASGLSTAADRVSVTTRESQRSVGQLYALVRNEQRDAGWASKAEVALRTALQRDLRMTDDDPLDVSCATTVCEVSGVAPPQSTRAAQLVATLDDPQHLLRELDDPKLVAVKRDAGTNSFTFYYRRRSE